MFTLGFLSELCTTPPHDITITPGPSPIHRPRHRWALPWHHARRWLALVEAHGGFQSHGGVPQFSSSRHGWPWLRIEKITWGSPMEKEPPNCGTTNYYETQKSGSSYHFWFISGYVHLKIIDTRVCLKLQHVKWAVKYILMVKWKWMRMMMMMNYGIFGMGMGQTPIMFDKASFDIQKD